MFAKISRGFLAVSVVAVLAGCNSSAPTEGLTPTANAAPAGQAATPVVQAFCPPVVMLEQTAIHRAYARGGENKPEKLLYQASLADATRQCSANETTMTINVVAQGRIVQGPVGVPGKVTLPVLVEVVDGDNVIYSQKVAFPVDIPAGGTSSSSTRRMCRSPTRKAVPLASPACASASIRARQRSRPAGA